MPRDDKLSSAKFFDMFKTDFYLAVAKVESVKNWWSNKCFTHVSTKEAGGELSKYKDDETYFTINEVAKQIGVVPATIRNWEKAGLFVAKRSANGYRIFDFNDIRLLEGIKQRSKDEGMGINAIRLLYHDARDDALKQNDGVVVSRKLLSMKWKEFRLERSYLLEDVAKAVGISASYLSKIENLQANVSLDVLRRLADFYGENLLYYINDAEGNSPLVKKNKGEMFSIGIPGISVESVVGLQQSTLSVMLYTVEPGAGRMSPSAHSGEEFVHLQTGRLDFFLGGECLSMVAGDSLTFSSLKTHHWYNSGNSTAKILWAYTPVTKERSIG